MDSPVIHQKQIPYIEGITHFIPTHFIPTSSGLPNYDDARIAYVNMLHQKKQYFSLFLKEFHSKLSTKTEYKEKWFDLVKNGVENQLLDFVVLVANDILIDSNVCEDSNVNNNNNRGNNVGDVDSNVDIGEGSNIEDNERLLQFVNFPNEKITHDTTRRLIFQVFHYLKNHPQFFTSLSELYFFNSAVEPQDLQLPVIMCPKHLIIDNHSIKGGTSFENHFFI
jgi:hypothetical protein